MICGLLGEKLSHSYSPSIHAMLGDYEYRLFPTERKDLDSFLRGGGFDGLNVTIPYKRAVLPYCKYLSPTAERIGAINTLIRHNDGSFSGFNTDYYGFGCMLDRLGVDVSGKKALILGTGGASGTVKAVLSDHQAGEVVFISRKGDDNYHNLEKHSDAQIIVNATPVGMYPDEGVCLVDLDIFPYCQGVLDLIYNPARTKLLLEAQRRRIPYINGLWMLISQAKASSELFTGQKIPGNVTEKIYKTLSMGMQNVILIGMPGCGKTTIGRALSGYLKREFYDSDDEFEKTYGISAGECIKSMGEKKFRGMETAVLRKLCMKRGAVIATGGGVVTVRENKDIMLANGVVIWLERDIKLLPTLGRPLSRGDGLDLMYEVRSPLYTDFADYEASNDKGISEVALSIKGKLRL